jgi:hypothetical protein
VCACVSMYVCIHVPLCFELLRYRHGLVDKRLESFLDGLTHNKTKKRKTVNRLQLKSQELIKNNGSVSVINVDDSKCACIPRYYRRCGPGFDQVTASPSPPGSHCVSVAP